VPFRSEQQRKWMYANEPEMAARWQKETPKGEKLPKKVKKKAMEKQAINDILMSLLAGGGLGGLGGAAVAHKYHKRKMPQYEEKGSIRGYEEGFADAGRTLQDQLQESMAPILANITRRREGQEQKVASLALMLMTKSAALPIPAGSAFRRPEQPPGMRDESSAKPHAGGRLLNRLVRGMAPQQAQAPSPRQALTPEPVAPKTPDLNAAARGEAESAEQLVAAHPSLGGQQHPEALDVPLFGVRGQGREIAQHALKSMPTQEVPPAPFEQFIREFKQKQMAPLW